MGSVFKARWAVCLLAACMAACACLLGGCAAGEASGGVLKVGVRADVVGFSSYNEHTGKFYGAEVDIAEELAERILYAGEEQATVEHLDDLGHVASISIRPGDPDEPGRPGPGRR